MNLRQRASAWAQAKQASRKPASEPVQEPAVEQEEIELMEDVADALEAEEKATKKRKVIRSRKKPTTED